MRLTPALGCDRQQPLSHWQGLYQLFACERPQARNPSAVHNVALSASLRNAQSPLDFSQRRATVSKARRASESPHMPWWVTRAWSDFQCHPFAQARERGLMIIRGLIVAAGLGDVEHFRRRMGHKKRTKKKLAEKIGVHQANLLTSD